MINPMDLTGKKILVTGATGGIGRETAVQLSKLGATLVISGRNPEKLQQTYGMLDGEGHAKYIVDLDDIDSLEEAMKSIVSECGAFHGYAHCAGVSQMRPFKMTKKENIIDMMNSSYFSFVEIVRCLSKKGWFEDGGSIVAISSTASIQGKQSKVAYSAAKAALDASVRCMICDLKKKKIRVNTVMPCWVNTRMYKGYIDRYPDTFEVQEIKEKQYMGVTEPIEVANTIAFLLSDAAKTITGTSILIDGGMLQG